MVLRFLPQYQNNVVMGVPTRPKRKSQSAKFFTTKLTYLNLPISLVKIETYNTNPLPRMLITAAIIHRAAEHQKTIQLVWSSTPSIGGVLKLLFVIEVEGIVDIVVELKFNILELYYRRCVDAKFYYHSWILVSILEVSKY